MAISWEGNDSVLDDIAFGSDIVLSYSDIARYACSCGRFGFFGFGNSISPLVILSVTKNLAEGAFYASLDPSLRSRMTYGMILP